MRNFLNLRRPNQYYLARRAAFLLSDLSTESEKKNLLCVLRVLSAAGGEGI